MVPRYFAFDLFLFGLFSHCPSLLPLCFSHPLNMFFLGFVLYPPLPSFPLLDNVRISSFALISSFTPLDCTFGAE